MCTHYVFRILLLNKKAGCCEPNSQFFIKYDGSPIADELVIHYMSIFFRCVRQQHRNISCTLVGIRIAHFPFQMNFQITDENIHSFEGIRRVLLKIIGRGHGQRHRPISRPWSQHPAKDLQQETLCRCRIRLHQAERDRRRRQGWIRRGGGPYQPEHGSSRVRRY